MNFDFAALLVLLTFVSGVIWAIDAWFLKPAASGERKEPVVVEYARSFFPVFFIVLILRSFVVEPFRIPSASMMPTLLIGDFILVNKFDYGLRWPVLNSKFISNNLPERGDIVVFRYPEDPSTPFIKRVIGVPGDEIIYYQKTLFVNGKKVDEELIGEYDSYGSAKMMIGNLAYLEDLPDVSHQILKDPHRSSKNVKTTVPEGNYFVLGDNRDNSKDSRYWGFVPEENLVGRAFMIWMNFDLKNGGVEFSRIGTIF